MAQQELTYVEERTSTHTLKYLLHLPRGYDAPDAEPWPLLLFLHGMGERGDDLDLIKKYGIPKVVESRPDFPFITVSPQCPAESWWLLHGPELAGLLDEVVARYPVDTRRIYITGLSMGGYGGWYLLTELPERFAAGLLICGGHTWYLDLAERAKRVRDVPLWIFHGDADEVVPIENSQQIVDALQAEGSRVRFTVYPGVGHDSWTQTYDNPEIYEWLLEHSLADGGSG